MNKTIFNKEDFIYTRTNIVCICLSLFLLYSMQLTKIANKENGSNVYDFFIQITDYLTFSYMIIPLFLILLPVYFSLGNVLNYFTFRFESKFSWYVYYLRFTLKISCLFLFSIVLIMLCQSIYIFDLLDFKNEWSEYSNYYYTGFDAFLSRTSPLFYTLISFMLILLQLWVLGLFFLNIFILLKDNIFSFILTYAVYLLNLVVIVNKIDNYYSITFYFHTNIFNYVFLNSLTQFSYSIFLYWFIWLIILIVSGLLLIWRTDLHFGKGKRE